MKTKLFPYISLILIASFLIAPVAQGFGPFWITMPELDEPAHDDAIIIPITPNEPAVWQDLNNKRIRQGSPDETIVYEDLYLMCDDVDDATVIYVSSSHDYNLEFNAEFDLFIEDLDPDYHGSEVIELNCNGVKNSFTLIVLDITIIVDKPASWEELKDQTILQGSADGTVVYEDLALKCYDPDDYEVVSIVSTNENYLLNWDGYDLVINALDSEYVGQDSVVLDCNGEYAKFRLSVSETLPIIIDDPTETSSIRDELFIGSVHFSTDIVIAGDIVPITVAMENKGGSKLKDVQVAAVIQELATRTTAKLDLSTNKKAKKILALEIPEYAEPGMYSVRLTFHNGDVSRVIYRDLYVI
jgi:hypothetical protein